MSSLSGPFHVVDAAALWRANALTLSADLFSSKRALVLAQKRMSHLESVQQVIEETTADVNHDKPQADHSEAGYAASLHKEATVGLVATNVQPPGLENQTPPTNLGPDCPPDSSPPVLAPNESSTLGKQVSVLTGTLEVALEEKAIATAELKRTLVAADKLCAQMASVIRFLGGFHLKDLKKRRSGHVDQEGAKTLEDKDEESEKLLAAKESLVFWTSNTIECVSTYQGVDKVLDKLFSGHYAQGHSDKSQPVPTTSSSVNQPINEPFFTKPLTTEKLKPVDLDYVVGASSAQSGAISTGPPQPPTSAFRLTPQEAAALKESIIGRDRPLVTELRPGIIVKTGRGTLMYEARATEFVARHTKVPVPQILASFDFEGFPCIVMTKVQGTTLEHALRSQYPWLNVPLVCQQLRDALRQLRSVPIDAVLGPGASDRIAPVCDAWNPRVGVVAGGPWGNLPVSDLQGYKSLVEGNLDWAPSERRLLSNPDPQAKTVLCHGDLAVCNIMVGECGLTGVIDWENLGTYPPEWEIESTLSGCRFEIDRAELALSYIPPCSPCCQAPLVGQACARRHSCHSADCVKSFL